MINEPVPDEDEVTVVATIFDTEQSLEISCDMRNVGNNVWRSVDAFMEISSALV